MGEDQKKISLPEIIIMVMIVGGADGFDVITGLFAIVPIIGQILLFMNFFVDIFVLAITQFWFIMKGGKGFKKQATALAGNLIEFIPLLDILPIRTATLIIVIYLINHPKVAKAAKASPTAE
ncbi:hypothetical protein COS61_01380 [Candidatus Wolfebacteria bacterium CG03_land_8_20_14_0_80_40_12]|uniref:Uncharacterized protein n=1 Tax=Candidatus Wolfebacteria bacterium CG03_land_8_20_14_0_80_40_12 TaxID=1975069 RepID=A0A2M7B5N6_9BACT|nr:MAG: hypothetical protein COS61_01380 [Candidatus Wolfebacteria bacterium CG03_land_8_20_14_0_80_40_12]